MTRDTMDVADWAEVRYSENEVPLVAIIKSIKKDRNSYTLRRSKQYPSSWLLWHQSKDEVVVATHAFVVRYSSPLETGNYVPDREILPEGLMDYMKKSEPSGLAQISLTFDSRMDDTLLPNLIALEDWAQRIDGFDTRNRKRNTWMSPQYVANQFKYTVTSQLFQAKTAFNSKANSYSVPYQVHPWIRDACIPHNPGWVPNPGRVQFFDGQQGRLEDLASSGDPQLRAGDLVKMTFKLSFTIGREMWNMQFVPLQVIRVGQVDSSTIGGGFQAEDHGTIALPQRGDRLLPISGPTSGQGSDNSSARSKDKAHVVKERETRSESSDSDTLTDWPASDADEEDEPQLEQANADQETDSRSIVSENASQEARVKQDALEIKEVEEAVAGQKRSKEGDGVEPDSTKKRRTGRARAGKPI